MPVARYQLADGRIARFEVPDGTTPEQAQQIGADYFAQQSPEPVATPAPQQPEAAPAAQQRQGTVNPFAAMYGGSMEAPGIPQNVRDLPEIQNSGLLAGESDGKLAALAPVLLTTTDKNEIAKIIQSNFPNVGVSYNRDNSGNVYPILVNNETGAATAINKPGMSGLDVMQAIGIGAAFTPAGRAGTVLGAGGKAALTEAAIQGGQAATGGDFDPEQVALAGTFGAAGKVGENAMAGVYRMARGSPQSQIVQEGADAGIPMMTSDVIPPQTFPGKALQQTAEKIPIAGTAGMRQSQQQMRERAVADVAEKYGEFSYDAIIGSLKTQKNKVKSAAGSVLETTGNKLDQAGDIALDNTLSAIEKAKGELTKPGVIKSPDAIADIQNLMDTLGEAPQTFTTLKQNRTAFREIVNATDKADRSQLTSRAKSLLNDIQTGMTKDMDELAKKNLTPDEFGKWKRANAVYAEEAQKLTKSKLKNVLDKGDITPESVKTMLFSQNPSDQKLLYNSLTQEGRRNARAAIISKIVNDTSRRQSGMTPNSFSTELKKYGNQVNTFFKGSEKKQLEGLSRALEATRRAQDAAVTTPTGQQLIGGLSVTGLYLDPTATLGTAGTLGGLARLYESAPVRNALLRLASVPRGSTGFERALTELQAALTAGAQSIRSAEAEELPPQVETQ